MYSTWNYYAKLIVISRMEFIGKMQLISTALLSTGPLGMNCSENWIEIHFHSRKYVSKFRLRDGLMRQNVCQKAWVSCWERCISVQTSSKWWYSVGIAGDIRVPDNHNGAAINARLSGYSWTWYALAWKNYDKSNISHLSMNCDKYCVLLLIVMRLFRVRSLQWRHNERDGMANHQPHDCLLNCLFRRRSKKIWKLRVTGLCEGNSQVTGEAPDKGPVTRKMFPFDDVIMKCVIVSFFIYIQC